MDKFTQKSLELLLYKITKEREKKLLSHIEDLSQNVKDLTELCKPVIIFREAYTTLKEKTDMLSDDSEKRKSTPVATGVLDYFPHALVAIAELSYTGSQKHNPNQPMFWSRSKSKDEDDALIRHFLERGTIDSDGIRHSVKVAWRALALLQKELEGAYNLPISRGSGE